MKLKRRKQFERESMQKKWRLFDEMRVKKKKKKMELLSLLFIVTFVLRLLNSQSVILLHLIFDWTFIIDLKLMRIFFNDICITKIVVRGIKRPLTCSSVDLIIEMAHKSTNTCRFSDIAGEPMRRLAPLRGFENEPLVSFEEGNRTFDRTCSRDWTYGL